MQGGYFFFINRETSIILLEKKNPCNVGINSSLESVQDLNFRLDMDLTFFTFLPMNREPTKIGQNSLTIKLVKVSVALLVLILKEKYFHEDWTDFQHLAIFVGSIGKRKIGMHF